MLVVYNPNDPSINLDGDVSVGKPIVEMLLILFVWALFLYQTGSQLLDTFREG